LIAASLAGLDLAVWPALLAAAPAGIPLHGLLVALIVVCAHAAWLAIDLLLSFLQRLPGLAGLFERTFIKKFRCYLHPSFRPRS
jgi:hypothetical protein